GSEPELHLDAKALEAFRQLGVLHLRARQRAVVVAVAPSVHARFDAGEIHPIRRSFGERHALAVIVDRDRLLVSVLDGPDDVLRSPRGVAAEKNVGPRGLHRQTIDYRHAVLVEVDADVALDPRKRVLLADGEDDVVAWNHDAVDDLTLRLAVVVEPAQAVELEADELSVLNNEPLWRVILDVLDTFLFSLL